MTATQVQNNWNTATPGKLITLDGDTGRWTLKKAGRPKGSPQVVIDLAGHTLTRDPEVGSSDTIIFKSGVRDLKITNGRLLACSRAGLKTEDPGGARDIWLDRLEVTGLWDATAPVSTLPRVKWLAHHYRTGSWIETWMSYWGCSDEHARYFHNIQGNHYFSGSMVKWCGRTALQVVNRMAENGTPEPEGYGDVTVEDETVEDVCLEQGGGGSAYTFRGGMKDSTVTLRRLTGRLGCDPDLHPSLRGRATGMVVVDSGPESSPGSGDAAWPGGTKAVYMPDCDFEVGTVYPGTGSAKRANVKIESCGLFSMTDGRIVVPAGEVALEIKQSCKEFFWSGSPEVIGDISYHGTTYATWDGFTAAHPECRA